MAFDWYTPKVDWVATDGLDYADMNQIGENLRTLHSGGGNETALPTATVTASNQLEIDMVHNVFELNSGGSSSSNIQYIQYTDGTTTRLPGNAIILVFDSSYSINDGTSPSGNYKSIDATGNTLNPTDGYAMMFVYTGTIWCAIGRTD